MRPIRPGHIGFPSECASAGSLEAGSRPSAEGPSWSSSLGAVTGCDLQEDADTDRGEQLFTQKCGSCHALTGAGTNADIGPDLDQAFAASRAAGMDQDTIEGVVQAQIENPRPASPENVAVYMPANLVEGEDAEAVAAYVASIAGVEGIEPPEFIASEFFATNCGGCHVLSAAGTTGNIGPSLDDVLPGQTRRADLHFDQRPRGDHLRRLRRRRDAGQLRRHAHARAAPRPQPVPAEPGRRRAGGRRRPGSGTPAPGN